MFREREHRQERIGIGMTLWPTRPTRGEEANEIEIVDLRESWGRILVSAGPDSATGHLINRFWEGHSFSRAV